MSKDTHKTRLFSYLEEHKTITSLQSIRDLGNTRLAATICLLRKDGYDIVRTYRYVGDEYKGPVPQLYSRW